MNEIKKIDRYSKNHPFKLKNPTITAQSTPSQDSLSTLNEIKK